MMNVSELKVNLPPGLSVDEARLLLAIKLYEAGKATMGQAARLAGYSRRTFIEVLGRYQIPVFNYSPGELREELGL